MPLRVSYKIFSKITFADIIYVMTLGVLYHGREGGTQKFFQKSVFRVGIGIGTRYATAGPYILWRIYCGVYTGVYILDCVCWGVYWGGG